MRWLIFSSSTTTDERRGAVDYNNNNNNSVETVAQKPKEVKLYLMELK